MGSASTTTYMSSNPLPTICEVREERVTGCFDIRRKVESRSVETQKVGDGHSSEDGGTIYSPRSYQDLFSSRKNNRVYAVINISEDPTVGCDLRSSLHIFEIDTISLKAKRDTVTLIDEKHDEEHDLVRFSNLLMFESRTSGNPVFLMRKHMSEFCPIKFGYDLSSYRYEVCLPTSSLEDE